MDENINNKKHSFSITNKRFFLIVVLMTIVISGLIASGFLLLRSFFDNDKSVDNVSQDISGAWELIVNPEVISSTDDEAKNIENTFYVFEVPDKYGRGEYFTCYQGGVEYFEYELLEEDSVEKINLGTENMEYKITGSKEKGDAKLTIIYPGHTDDVTGNKKESSEYVFVQTANPDYDKQSFVDYSVDKSLVGSWINNERTLPYFQYTYTYEQSVEIKNNGIMIIHYKSTDLMLDRYMYYAYTAENSNLTFSLVTDKDTKYTIPYEFDESGNLKFLSDTTQNSIFADAFFGDYTFYTSDNSMKGTTQFAD